MAKTGQDSLDQLIVSTVKNLAMVSGTGRPSLGEVLANLPKEIPLGEAVKMIGTLVLDGRLGANPGRPVGLGPCLLLSISK